MSAISSYSINCYGNLTCVDHLINVQKQPGNQLISYFEPESLCKSCSGNSDCNNTNSVCTKKLVHLSYETTSTLGQNLRLIQVVFNYTQPKLPSPSVGCLFKSKSECQRKRTEEQIETVVSYSDKTIFVTSSNPINTIVFWSLNEYAGSFLCNPGDCQYKLPDTYLVKDGVLRVQVFIGDSKDSDRSFAIVAAHTCQIRECSFICMDYITNFVCYSLSTQILIGGSFIMSSILMVILIVYLLYKIYCCTASKYYVHLKGDSSIPMQTMTVSLICLCLLMAPVSGQCLTTSIIQAEINSCSSFQGNNSCTLQLNTLINLQRLGSKVCILLTSPTGETLATMNITYMTSLIKVDTTPLYFSSDWQGIACSTRSCRNDNICNLQSGCPQDPNNFQQILSGECLTWPGKSICQSSCGCAGCGCFFCSDACLVSRYAFKPIGSIAQIFSIDGARSVPRILVDYQPINGQRLSFDLDITNPIDRFNFTFTLIGSYASLTPYFQNTGFVNYGSNSYLAPISSYNNPIFNTVGDIQSTTTNFAPGVPFLFPSTSVEGIASQYAVDYLFPQSGVKLLNSNTILPKVVNGISWTSAGTYPVGLNPNPGAVSLSLQSLPLSYSFLSTTVCPKINSLTSAGCFNCPQGASFSINSLSLCDSGSVLVSVESQDPILIATQFISLSKSSNNFIIYFSSVKQHISGSLCLSYKTNKDCFSFSTVLNVPPPLTPNEIQDIFGNFSFNPPYSDFTSWWDSLTGTATIVKVVLIMGIVLAAVIFLVGLSYIGYRIYVEKKAEFSYNIMRNLYTEEESDFPNESFPKSSYWNQ